MNIFKAKKNSIYTESHKTESDIEQSVFLRVINFGLKHPEGFSSAQIITELKLKGWEKTVTEKYLDNSYRNSNENLNLATPFLAIKITGLQPYNNPYNEYIIGFEASFAHLDYLELKFARKNAKEAKNLSITAIIISIVFSVIVPLLVAELVTQTVKIDSEQINNTISDVENYFSSTTTRDKIQ